MKVMLSTDIEGVSGVVDHEQIFPGNPLYEEARRWLTHDINAAVEGCLEGGATEVIVTDAHAMRMNVAFEELHPEAQLIVGGSTAHRPQLVMESMDSSFDLALLIGMHAAAHYPGGILSHSYHLPANFFEVRINDMPVGEPEIATALAGAVGVPCGLITGDDVTVNEYLKLRPETEGVIVKWALDRTAARCLTLPKTAELIRAGAKRAVERAAAGEFSPWTFEPPLLLSITCANYGLANKLAGMPGSERLDRRVVGFRTDSFLELYRALITYAYLTLTAIEKLS
ncbi:MAG TPA: M55 family metallopeptidase [Solirubrobacteraceae bacterium]|jgi:D-amino peptidase|nr:M55 family metallopeptidase [Solirubrobacteraceae bacterium]